MVRIRYIQQHCVDSARHHCMWRTEGDGAAVASDAREAPARRRVADARDLKVAVGGERGRAGFVGALQRLARVHASFVCATQDDINDSARTGTRQNMITCCLGHVFAERGP